MEARERNCSITTSLKSHHTARDHCACSYLLGKALAVSSVWAVFLTIRSKSHWDESKGKENLFSTFIQEKECMSPS